MPGYRRVEYVVLKAVGARHLPVLSVGGYAGGVMTVRLRVELALARSAQQRSVFASPNGKDTGHKGAGEMWLRGGRRECGAAGPMRAVKPAMVCGNFAWPGPPRRRWHWPRASLCIGERINLRLRRCVLPTVGSVTSRLSDLVVLAVACLQVSKWTPPRGARSNATWTLGLLNMNEAHLPQL